MAIDYTAGGIRLTIGKTEEIRLPAGAGGGGGISPGTGDLLVRVEDVASPANPIADADVTISAAGFPAQVTDADGLTSFVGVPVGSVHITATSAGSTGQRDATVTASGTRALAAAGPVVIPIKSPRLRLSLFDFNPSFIKRITWAGGKATGLEMDTDLLDIFQAARIDDYSMVSTIAFDTEDADHNAAPPQWWGLAPFGMKTEAFRTEYLQKLTQEMHGRGAQVFAGYEMVESGTNVSTRGKAFRSFLANATAAQVEAHAADIVAFFTGRSIDIDGLGFDIELNGFGKAHATNLAVLLNATARGFAAARPGAVVYYDTGPFQPNDGEGCSPIMSVQTYALTNGAPNLIARPMCYNGVVISESRLAATIECALRDTGAGGGGMGTSRALQPAIDVSRTTDATVKHYCADLFRPNLVGMTIYTMPGGAGAQKGFLAKAAGWEAALNPGAPPPGTSGDPQQVPVP